VNREENAIALTTKLLGLRYLT